MLVDLRMPNSSEFNASGSPTFDPAVQSDNIAFSQHEMLACDGCSRQNPPNRTNCIYCGTELAFRTANLEDRRPITRDLEAWESGFNVIVRSQENDQGLSAASKIVREDIELKSIVELGIPMPVARFESLRLAETLASSLQKLGIDCSVVSDADLDVERMPVRLSSIEIADGKFLFTDFNTHAIHEIAFADLTLLVSGQLNSTRTDVVEKRKRKGTKVMDETASFADEKILDLYAKCDTRGFRINPAGFDFSCLGVNKSMLAGENLDRLVTFLSDFSSNVRVETSYAKARQLLGPIWEIEIRREVQGMIRSGIGKRGFGRVESTSNLRQFTKYSRLQRHLL